MIKAEKVHSSKLLSNQHMCSLLMCWYFKVRGYLILKKYYRLNKYVVMVYVIFLDR